MPSDRDYQDVLRGNIIDGKNGRLMDGDFYVDELVAEACAGPPQPTLPRDAEMEWGDAREGLIGGQSDLADDFPQRRGINPVWLVTIALIVLIVLAGLCMESI